LPGRRGVVPAQGTRRRHGRPRAVDRAPQPHPRGGADAYHGRAVDQGGGAAAAAADARGYRAVGRSGREVTSAGAKDAPADHRGGGHPGGRGGSASSRDSSPGSTLPPETTATVRPGGSSSRRYSHAARATAPLGSATSRASPGRAAVAARISSSVTVTMPASDRDRWASVTSDRGVRRPSATVR